MYSDDFECLNRQSGRGDNSDSDDYTSRTRKVLIENNIAVLVEKPLAANVEQGREIVEIANKKNAVVAVGHSERCNPVVQAIKKTRYRAEIYRS